jgi:dihydrofolate reductase
VEVVSDTPADLIKRAAAQGYSELAVCGGASIYTMFLQAGVVDKLYLTIEPILFGQGLPLFDQQLEVKLELVELHRLSDQTTMLEYQVLN